MRQIISCLCLCSFLKTFWISAVDMSSVDSEELEKTLFSGLLTGHCQSASSRVKVQHSSEFSVSAFSSLSKFLIWIETETELIFLTDSLTSLTSLSVGNCGDPSRGAFGGRAPRCLQEKFESGSRTWTRFRCNASHSSYSTRHSNFNFVSELRLGSAAFFDSPYLKKIFQDIPWVSGFFFADHFVWNLFGSRKRSRVHWGFGGIFFFIGNCLCFSTVWSLFCLEGVFCPQGFWIWFWIFSVLDSGSWGLDFGVWFWTPTVWLSSASTWGAKSTHSLQRGLRENPKGWSSSKCAKCSSQRCVT